MRSNIPGDHPLRKLFNGLVEQAFMSELGICEPRLTDYLGDLLTDFIHVDCIYRLRSVDGETIREISRMEAEASLGPDISEHERRRVINQYIGDLTLFWSGVYPESLRGRRTHVDRLQVYLVQGKRSYEIASCLTRGDEHPPADLLRRLSDEFEHCVHGLQLVREGWQRLAQSAAGN